MLSGVLACARVRPRRRAALDPVKDPADADSYVTDLAAPDVVNTMPEAALRAVANHGRLPEDSVRGQYADARQLLSELEALGVEEVRHGVPGHDDHPRSTGHGRRCG